MVIRVGKPDKESEDNEKSESTRKLAHPILLTILIILFILVLLSFSVTNLPGRYKAIVHSDSKEVLLLDTVKGNVWAYRGNTGFAVLTYLSGAT